MTDQDVLVRNDYSDGARDYDPVNSEVELNAISQQETRADPVRWYILTLFSLITLLQALIWNSFGPVTDSLQFAFGWTDSTIALINIVCLIGFIIGTPPVAWLLDVKGLRISMIFCILTIAAGAGLRCITSSTPHVTWLAIVCAFLDGLAGVVAFGGIALVSAVWFPAKERVAATSISTCFNGMGVSVTFLMAPALVPPPPPGNSSSSYSSFHTYGNSSGNSSHHDVEEIKQGYMLYMYIVFGISVLLSLCTVVYFPNKPKHAPSVSASVERTDYMAGLKALMRKKLVWGLAGTYAISNGVYNAWMSVLAMNLTPIGISQTEAGYIGFAGFTSGMVATVFVGIFSAVFARRMKSTLLTLYGVGTIFLVVFSLVCFQILPKSTALIYSTCIIGSICLCGAVPLFFELACESAYPIAEGITNCFVTLLQNFTAMLFLLVLLVPQAGTMWMSWGVVGCTAVCIPVFVMLKEDYRRFDVDTAWET